MKKILIALGIFLLLGGAWFLASHREAPPALIPPGVDLEESAALPIVSVSHERILQGDPVMFTILSTSTPVSASFAAKPLPLFQSGDEWRAFYGVDLNAEPGTYALTIRFSDGSTYSEELAITKRVKDEAPLGIPPQLGGNTPEAQRKFMETLARENASLLNLPTATTTLWTEPFRYPVDNPVITDEYGYTRRTGPYAVAHKGTDFRAAEGAPIYAMNRGIVRVAREYRNYGHTIVLDHGLGLQTFYMHLSRRDVSLGQTVERGERLGLAGSTGYSTGPHLHLTVRIGDISIDPIVFLNFFR